MDLFALHQELFKYPLLPQSFDNLLLLYIEQYEKNFCLIKEIYKKHLNPSFSIKSIEESLKAIINFNASNE